MKTTSLRPLLFRLTGQLVYRMTGMRNYNRDIVPYVWGFASLTAIALGCAVGQIILHLLPK